MAYSFASASSQYLSVASAVATAAPLTLACWVYKTNVADASSVLLTIGNENQSTPSSFNLVHNVSNNTIRANAQELGGVGQVAISTSGLTNNTWGHACGVFASSTSRTAYCNGGNTGTNTGSATPASLTRTLIGVGFFGSLTNYANGLIAECGIWNVALTVDEIASLAKGMTCDKVRPQSLVFYAPLVRELQDVRGGLTITNNNTATVANHPRVYA